MYFLFFIWPKKAFLIIFRCNISKLRLFPLLCAPSVYDAALPKSCVSAFLTSWEAYWMGSLKTSKQLAMAWTNPLNSIKKLWFVTMFRGQAFFLITCNIYRKYWIGESCVPILKFCWWKKESHRNSRRYCCLAPQPVMGKWIFSERKGFFKETCVINV